MSLLSDLREVPSHGWSFAWGPWTTILSSYPGRANHICSGSSRCCNTQIWNGNGQMKWQILFHSLDISLIGCILICGKLSSRCWCRDPSFLYINFYKCLENQSSSVSREKGNERNERHIQFLTTLTQNSHTLLRFTFWQGELVTRHHREIRGVGRGCQPTLGEDLKDNKVAMAPWLTMCRLSVYELD